MKLFKGMLIVAIAIVACFFGSGHGDFQGAAGFRQRAKSLFSNLTARTHSIFAGDESVLTDESQFSGEMPRLVTSGSNDLQTVDLSRVDHGDAPAVARAFMQAIKVGDADSAGELLTFAAKHAMAGEGLKPVAQATPAAFFHIGATEYGDENLTAHVECSWTDAGEISIVLRREVPGWRIAGIVHENGPKDVYSFESPKSLLR